MFGNDTKIVIKKSISAGLVKACGMAFSIAVSVFIGRTIGKEGLGIVNIANNLISVVLAVCLIGVPNILVKQVAIAKSENDKEKIDAYLTVIYLVVGVLSTGITCLLVYLSPFIANEFFDEPRLVIPLVISLIGIFPLVLSSILSYSLIGSGKVWQGSIGEQTISPGLTGLFILPYYYFKGEISVEIIVSAYVVSRILVAIIMGFYWKKLHGTFGAIQKGVKVKVLVKETMPFFFINVTGILLINSDKLMLGWLGSVSDVGLYSVAGRLAMVTIFFQQVSNAAISPKLAELYKQNRIDEMEKLIRQVTTILTILAVLALLSFILYGELMLTIWGAEFNVAYPLLIILGIGQFFNISTGSVASILNMCGYEKLHSRLSVILLVVSFLLNFILIKLWGGIGLAISTTVVIILTNLIKVFIVKMKVGIWSLPLLWKYNLKKT